jgi:hypothetical protein
MALGFLFLPFWLPGEQRQKGSFGLMLTDWSQVFVAEFCAD